MTFVKIEGLSKVFIAGQPPALFNISAEIRKGEIVGLVGPDGAGKTTLLRLMTGLLLPTEGGIEVGGFDTILDSEKVHEITGYMPQRFGLYEDLTVSENLELYAELRCLEQEKKAATFERLLQFTGLTPFTKRLGKDLSGGMKQKLGLACSLLKKPELLLLDEPSVGVDPISRRELWKMVYDLLDESISIVWSTSYLDEAEKCHTVLLLNEGKLHFFGKPSELTEKMAGRVFKVEKPENKRSCLSKLLEQENVLDGVIQGSDIRIILKRKEPITGFELKETTPRFEDAFIEILGGGAAKVSELALSMPKIENPIDFPVIAEQLTKRFGNFTAADRVSFQVKRGEIFGLLGPNGAGKSTTFKMLCGLLKPTEGKASVSGVDLIKAPGEARSQIGYMAQKFSLYGDLTVRQNLEFFAGVYNLSGNVKKEAIDRKIELFALAPYLDKTSSALPLGFKQKLSLAAATMHWPNVLFLDEPTSGMDPVSRREFWMHANSLAAKGCTIMVSTHFMDEAENCDRIALIYRGKIIHLDAPDALKEIVKSEANPNPTLEDAFVKMIEEYDAH
jgi:ABC-2 type transport system ATP-binding protein